MPFAITVPYQTWFIFLEKTERVFVAEQPSSRAEINMRGATAAPSYRDWLVEAPQTHASLHLVYFSRLQRVFFNWCCEKRHSSPGTALRYILRCKISVENLDCAFVFLGFTVRLVKVYHYVTDCKWQQQRDANREIWILKIITFIYIYEYDI